MKRLGALGGCVMPVSDWFAKVLARDIIIDSVRGRKQVEALGGERCVGGPCESERGGAGVAVP